MQPGRVGVGGRGQTIRVAPSEQVAGSELAHDEMLLHLANCLKMTRQSRTHEVGHLGLAWRREQLSKTSWPVKSVEWLDPVSGLPDCHSLATTRKCPKEECSGFLVCTGWPINLSEFVKPPFDFGECCSHRSECDSPLCHSAFLKAPFASPAAQPAGNVTPLHQVSFNTPPQHTRSTESVSNQVLAIHHDSIAYMRPFAPMLLIQISLPESVRE
ncbi:unnamed protein product [Protopolystoma xenopodis]|uniref:Uncharacterized protein n=1 Tax=Protopolystoma xenopodis TaxID=117903 RepID=A0A3S5CK75_9PLAT|nr:unnamed protein product [Protopolystoma xenopodis]